jgi:2,3,4,5-tetrahydropyridine-2-carboxylate N-succinyltransferase
VQDRDGRIGPAEAERALRLLPSLGPAVPDAIRELLQRARGGERLHLRAIASPVKGLLARLVERAGDKADTAAFVELLNAGDVRAAEKVNGRWEPQPYVIDGILNYFKVQDNFRVEPGYWDKIPLRTAHYTDEEFRQGGVRYAPGCRVRTGCYIGPGTVVMNQAFINIGAYIAGEGVMVDGGARIASCAQIGKGVKFGAGSGIEGILEPAGRLPSIVEDHAKIGAMCEVSGIIGEGAVVASGVVMASGKKIFDEETGQIVPALEIQVAGTPYQVPVIPPYRLAVGGSLIAESGRFATDAIILKPGDLRDRATLKHFEKQGVLYQ